MSRFTSLFTSAFASMAHAEKKRELSRLFLALGGATLHAASINLFITPAKLYNGGLMGFCQLFYTLLTDFWGFSFGNFNLTGVLYYLINIPIFLLSFNRIGKRFFIKTLCCVTWITLAMSILPVPESPLLVDDLLGTCIIGGVISGFGLGSMLRMGASSGGMDIIGMLLIKVRKNLSVGKVSLSVNLVLYSICLLLFSVPTVIYSLIVASVSSISVDRFHDQTINVEVRIITKKDPAELNRAIFAELDRGITLINCTGGYTGKEGKILYVLLSKYEARHLKQIVREHDPEAFIVINEKVRIEGNYIIKL